MKKQTEQTAAPLGGALISAQVASRLVEALRTGAYAGCDHLPPELELASALGVSRTVVRDALSELERAGYIERVRGIGTMVNRDVVALQRRLDQKLEFNRMIAERGRHPHSDHLLVTRQEAGPELAKSLELRPGQTVLYVRRRVLADELPVLFSIDVLPLALFGGARIDQLDFSRPIFDLLEQVCDVQITSTVAHMRAAVGDPAIRRLLGLAADKALLELDEVCYTRLCAPAMHSYTYYTDFFDFAMVRKLL